MVAIKLLPENDKTNGWSAVLPPRKPKAPLAEKISVDWAVIGAGYAGLAAARRLAEQRPSDRIVVLEAGVAGEGAQGRNAGFAIDQPHNLSSSYNELESAARYKRSIGRRSTISTIWCAGTALPATGRATAASMPPFRKARSTPS